MIRLLFFVLMAGGHNGFQYRGRHFFSVCFGDIGSIFLWQYIVASSSKTVEIAGLQPFGRCCVGIGKYHWFRYRDNGTRKPSYGGDSRCVGIAGGCVHDGIFQWDILANKGITLWCYSAKSAYLPPWRILRAFCVTNLTRKANSLAVLFSYGDSKHQKY